MKKYLFSLSAVLLAVAFSAFTTSNMRVEYIFQYDGTSYTNQAAVQNPANWDYISTSSDDLACDDDNKKACRIKVSASAVDLTVSPFVLKSIADIDATLYDGPSQDTYYVSGGSSVMAYSNKIQ